MKKFSDEDIKNYPSLAPIFIESNSRRSQYDWLFWLMKILQVIIVLDVLFIAFLLLFVDMS